MAMKYTVSATDLPSGAVADTFTTLLTIVAANTQGHRARLRSLCIGPSDNNPADVNASFQLKRVDSVSGGSAGTATAVTPALKDSLSRASVLTSGKAHTVEPTTYGLPTWEFDMNNRSSVIKEWAADDAPTVNLNQLLGLLVAPRTGSAQRFTVSMEYEEF